jgi:predicted nuclease of predicted toxin-antitoxin system
VKFLADMGISPLTVKALCQEGYDAIHLQEQGLGRLADSAILEKAKQEMRVVLTCDLDFGELLAVSNQVLPSVIIFRRLPTYTPTYITSRLLDALSEYTQDLTTGAILIIEESRYRLRRLPIQPVEE